MARVTRAARHDVYGVVVGKFSGGAQLWIAPAKIAVGTILSILICLPSLYIFTCRAGSMLNCEPLRVRHLQPSESGRTAFNRIRTGRLDLFTINGLRRVHGCAAHRSVGDRNYVWFAFA